METKINPCANPFCTNRVFLDQVHCADCIREHEQAEKAMKKILEDKGIIKKQDGLESLAPLYEKLYEENLAMRQSLRKAGSWVDCLFDMTIMGDDGKMYNPKTEALKELKKHLG